MFRSRCFFRACVLAVTCECQHFAFDIFQGSWEVDLESLHSALLGFPLFLQWELAAHVRPLAPVMRRTLSAWDAPST